MRKVDLGGNYRKGNEFLSQTLIFSPYIFATQRSRPLIFQTMNCIRSKNLSLKYQRFTLLGCKNIGTRKFEFVAKPGSFWDDFLITTCLKTAENKEIVKNNVKKLKNTMAFFSQLKDQKYEMFFFYYSASNIR